MHRLVLNILVFGVIALAPSLHLYFLILRFFSAHVFSVGDYRQIPEY